MRPARLNAARWRSRSGASALLVDRFVSVEVKLRTALARRARVDLPAWDDAIGTRGGSPDEGSVR